MTDLVAGELASVDVEVDEPPEALLEEYRRELTGYCYRMLGSAFDAEDAVQETMVRAWRAADRFEGRSSYRSWLYRIATNVCFDSLNGRRRRALPMDLAGPSAPVEASIGAPLAEGTWLEPFPDARMLTETADPADMVVARESVRLAFVAALQLLPPRQRAVLVLREVLRWKADEVADLLDTSVASVNSALQRARATMSAHHQRDPGTAPEEMDAEHADLLERYVVAFEAYDIDALVALLHEDATQCMPPFALWLNGPVDIRRWHDGPGRGCRGSRVLRVHANGQPALAQYRPPQDGSAENPRWLPFCLHVLEVRDGRIASITNFLDTRLFRLFGLPDHLPA